MKIFLDTSSLFKLYHQEHGTQELEEVIEKMEITHIYLSELTKIEFSSAVWKRVRTKDITPQQAITTVELFEHDLQKYNFVSIDSLIIEQAKDLVSKYALQGLRTLDSIQLSTCINLAHQVDCFFTTDTLLKLLMQNEQLNTDIS